MRTALLALALCAGTTAARASAQTLPPPAPAGDMEPGGPAGRAAGMRGMGGIGALMRADANGDGVITREEALASSDAMFDRLDTNHDGTVSPDEMRAARDMMRPRGAPPRGDLGAAPPPPGQMPPGPVPAGPVPAGPMPAGPVPAGLSRQQWHDRALRQFDRFDANHDGKVDRAEIAAFQAAMRERRQERRGGDMPPPPPPPVASAPRP